VHPLLGKPEEPGPFTLTAFHLARRVNGKIEPLFAPPADLVLEAPAEENAPPQAYALNPQSPPEGILTSFPLPLLPILAQEEREKPVSGYWLTAEGWACYLAGKLPDQARYWVRNVDLWKIDERIGIGLNPATRSVKDGSLFSTQAIVFQADAGFLVRTTGGEAPQGGILRLGGDGRAAAVLAGEATFPEPDIAAILRNSRARLILTTPGIFDEGWLPTGAKREGNGFVFDLKGVRARLAAAAVPRFAVVSGWDLAKWQPKTAQRAAPVGTVYWLEDIEADETALRRLVIEGLWETPCENPARRAEGFNRCALAVWPKIDGGNHYASS
jgi:CRISPR-associated protein Cmr3